MQLEKLDDRLVLTSGLAAISDPIVVVSDGGNPAVAMAPDGDYLVSWESGWQNGPVQGSTSNIEGQRRVFDDSDASSGEFVVNSTPTTGFQQDPAAAIHDDGSVVVTWNNEFDASYLARRYDAQGSPLGDELNIGGGFDRPKIANNADGFVAVWDGVGALFAQGYDGAGAPVFPSSIYLGDGMEPDVAMNSDGSFVVTWASFGVGILGQVYEADGQKRGSEFQLDDDDPDIEERNPEVDVDDAGNFVVTWGTQEGRSDPILGFVYDAVAAKAQRFDANGNRVGSEIVLGVSAAPTLHVDGAGNFVATVLEDDGQLFVQAFDSGGNPLADAIEIAPAADSHDVAIGDNGEIAVSWGDADIVYVQEYLADFVDVALVGTLGDDLVEVVFGVEQHSITINGGAPTVYDAAQIQSFVVDGLGGNDEIVVTGTPASDTATADGDTGSLSLTSADYQINASGFETVTLDGGEGVDYGTLYGSSDATKKDRLRGLPKEDGGTIMYTGYQGSDPSTADYVISMQNFNRVESDGRGGDDYASLLGTNGDDFFYRFATYEVMVGPGMVQKTEGFERVDALGRLGNDSAHVIDTAGNDSYYSFEDYSVLLLGNGHKMKLKGFENLRVDATEGGTDTANIRNAQSTDMLFASAGAVLMMREAQYESLHGFDVVDAKSTAGQMPMLSLLDDTAGLITNGTWKMV